MPGTATATPVEVDVAVGSFFVCSWGYDQTNVDFYKVVALTPKGVKVQKWTTAVRGGRGGPQESVVPGDSPVTGSWVRSPEGYTVYDPNVEAPVEQKRLRRGGYKGASFYVNSYSDAYLWDGAPEYQTGSGWGR